MRLIRTLLVVILLLCLPGLLGCALRESETPQQAVANNAAGMGGETALPDGMVRRTLDKNDGVSAIMEFLDGTEAPATWWIRYESTGEERQLQGVGPVVMNGGDVIYVGENGTVRRLSPSGSEEVLRSGGTVGSLTPDPNEEFLAFLYLPNGDERQVALYDLSRAHERIIYRHTRGEDSLRIWGWQNGDILLTINRAVEGGSMANVLGMQRLSLDGTIGAVDELSDLPAAESFSSSFDGRFIAYQSTYPEPAVIILDLKDLSYQIIADSINPVWSEDGLEVLQRGATVLVGEFVSKSIRSIGHKTVEVTSAAHDVILDAARLRLSEFHRLNLWDMGDVAKGDNRIPGIPDAKRVLLNVGLCIQAHSQIGDFAPVILVRKDGQEVKVGFNRDGKVVEVYSSKISTDEIWTWSAEVFLLK